MPYGIRYVSANTTPGGDGSTTGTAGATRAWTINEVFVKLSGGVEHRILNDGTHFVTGNITLAGAGVNATGRIQIVGCDSVGNPVNPSFDSSGNIDWTNYPKIIINSGFNLTNNGTLLCDMIGLSISGKVNAALMNWSNGNQGSTTQFCRITNASNDIFAGGLNLFNTNHVINCEINSSGSYGLQCATSLAYSNVIANCRITANSNAVVTTANNYFFNNLLIAYRGRGILMGSANNTAAYFAYTAINNTVHAPSGSFSVYENYPSATGGYYLFNNNCINGEVFVDKVTSGGIRSATGVSFNVVSANNVLINTPTGSAYGSIIQTNNASLSGTYTNFVSATPVYSPYPSTSGLNRKSMFNNNIGAMGSANSRYVGELS